MYSREVKAMPENFVVNSHPVFGTFEGHPKKLDIRGVFSPYGLFPLPKFITNLRIKSNLIFSFNCEEYIGNIVFVDAKVMGFVQVIFWNKNTRQKFVYRSIMGPRKRLIPHNMENATTANFSKKRYVRITWDKNQKKLSVLFHLKGDSVRPAAQGALVAAYDQENVPQITTVKPFPTMRRCHASFNTFLPIQGSITLVGRNGEVKNTQINQGHSFFNVTRSYLKFRSSSEYICGFTNVRGKSLGFRISTNSHESNDSEKYNSNVLFYDGTVTPLPPVRITHYNGLNNQWVIQDTDNMVDLTFTPLSINTNKISAFILHSVYQTIMGTVEGAFITKDGQKVSFKSMEVIAERTNIRL